MTYPSPATAILKLSTARSRPLPRSDLLTSSASSRAFSFATATAFLLVPRCSTPRTTNHRYSPPRSAALSAKSAALFAAIAACYLPSTLSPTARNEAVSFEPTSAAAIPGKSSEQLRETLVKSGQLALFRERPFGHVARAKHTPRDIFVSAIASAPLAPDPAVLVEGNEEYFQAGIDACAKLTLGAVHLSVPGTGSVCSAFSGAKNCQIHEFSGPHPAGVVGVQIHHIAPVRSRQDIVWTITVQGLIQLGKLFVLGRVSPEKIVSVAGTSALDRRYFRTINGAPLQNVIRGQVADETIRYISGDVLTGTDIGAEGFVGLYDDMVTLIPESIDSEFVGWMQPGFRKHSMFRTYVSPWLPKQKHRLDTKVWGGHRALLPPTPMARCYR